MLRLVRIDKVENIDNGFHFKDMIYTSLTETFEREGDKPITHYYRRKYTVSKIGGVIEKDEIKWNVISTSGHDRNAYTGEDVAPLEKEYKIYQRTKKLERIINEN